MVTHTEEAGVGASAEEALKPLNDDPHPLLRVLELKLKLIQTRVILKPLLWVEVDKVLG
jgi:hypothetical protein